MGNLAVKSGAIVLGIFVLVDLLARPPTAKVEAAPERDAITEAWCARYAAKVRPMVEEAVRLQGENAPNEAIAALRTLEKGMCEK